MRLQGRGTSKTHWWGLGGRSVREHAPALSSALHSVAARIRIQEDQPGVGAYGQYAAGVPLSDAVGSWQKTAQTLIRKEKSLLPRKKSL